MSSRHSYHSHNKAPPSAGALALDGDQVHVVGVVVVAALLAAVAPDIDIVVSVV